MERISAFMDGESSPAETHQAVQQLKQDTGCEETWSTFHLIGDAMRGDAHINAGFMERFHARLADEPTQLAPRRLSLGKYANYALSAAASLSAVAIVLALVFSNNPLMPKTEVAQAPLLSAPPLRAASAGNVNGYLMAHQEYSPSTALQGMAPYIRTVSESHVGDNR